MFEDHILLKIKREYSKDESFALVLKKLSEAQIENGILKSELSELKDKMKKPAKTKKQWLEEDLFTELKEKLNKHQKRETKLQKEVNEWRDNYFALLRKPEINDPK